MKAPIRGIVVFVGATLGAAAVHQVATREGAKLGLPHVAVGVIAVIADHAI